MRTLELRVRQHSENALKVAQFLEQHPKVEKVYYAGLESSPYHDRAISQFTDAMCGGMVSADIAGGAKGAEDFIAPARYQIRTEPPASRRRCLSGQDQPSGLSAGRTEEMRYLCQHDPLLHWHRTC